ncbi:hypothetical protein K3217_01405 [bacterium BD-1]|nr:hypothetical protein [Ottowia caeni]
MIFIDAYVVLGLYAFAMSSLSETAVPRRLFTALFPVPDASTAIDAERRNWPGLPRRLRPTPERMHLTLQFFNQVDAVRERDWLLALKELRFEPFEVSLTQAEIWRVPTGTIAVLLPELTPELAELHVATSKLARRVDLPAVTQGWRPHVTTLRRAESVQLQPLTQAIRWRVSCVELIWSELNAQPPRYHRLGQFGGACA